MTPGTRINAHNVLIQLMGVVGGLGGKVLRWDRCIIREMSKLLRDLLKVERIPVPKIGGQLFIAFYEKGGHYCREQTSLSTLSV
jgi:hypothetical protein